MVSRRLLVLWSIPLFNSWISSQCHNTNMILFQFISSRIRARWICWIYFELGTTGEACFKISFAQEYELPPPPPPPPLAKIELTCCWFFLLSFLSFSSALPPWSIAQMANVDGERTIVLSLFWDDSEEVLVQVQSALIGADLRELDGVIELSQRPGTRPFLYLPLFDPTCSPFRFQRQHTHPSLFPLAHKKGDETNDFVMGRVKGKLSMGVNMVPFFNELIHHTKSDRYRAKVNMLASFRNLDLQLKTDNMERAYRRFAERLDILCDVRGLSSLKMLILAIIADSFNDNSLPTPVKDTYFAALSTLRGLARIHLQVNSQIVRLTFDSANITSLLPTKNDLSNWKTPPETTTTPPAGTSPPPSRWRF